MTTFEDKFMDIQASMISLCMEYVQGQADKVYIYGIADSLLSFNVFYNVQGHIVHKHQVNEFYDNNHKIDVSLQSDVLRYGVDDVESMIQLCKEYHREHPTELWLVYDAKTNSLESRYSYEGRYDKDEDLELQPNEEFDKWFDQAKSGKDFLD